MVSFSIGMAGASFPWVPETLPPVGVGFSWFWQWTFCAIIGKFVPIIENYFGAVSLSVFFTVMCFLGFFILGWICVETKGKSPAVIINEYRNLKWKPFKLF